MEILFTECPIASVLLADWSKSPNWGAVLQPFFTLVHIWSNFCSCYYLLQPFFSIYITIGVTSLFLLLLLLYDLLGIFDFGVFLLKISYLLQLKPFLVFMDRSKFFIFSNSLQFHHICFYSHWSIIFIFEILLQSITSVFIPFGVYFLSLTNCSKSHILPA